MKRQMRKPPNHNLASRPEVSFTFPKQNANATSNRPAIMSRSQFIIINLYAHKSYHTNPCTVLL